MDPNAEHHTESPYTASGHHTNACCPNCNSAEVDYQSKQVTRDLDGFTILCECRACTATWTFHCEVSGFFNLKTHK